MTNKHSKTILLLLSYQCSWKEFTLLWTTCPPGPLKLLLTFAKQVQCTSWTLLTAHMFISKRLTQTLGNIPSLGVKHYNQSVMCHIYTWTNPYEFWVDWVLFPVYLTQKTWQNQLLSQEEEKGCKRTSTPSECISPSYCLFRSWIKAASLLGSLCVLAQEGQPVFHL